ncbi:hypothetical protein L6164_001572 [Bauhinia variegata]|uniref:Uncharacterized protein n=1 Tax=Bauhinia variegata TaxID=167791 RepID=A0ACB9QH24_BAUVA|nr:hypothetical protein L6164_001572 [Bauhinia variegata]
MIGFRERLQRRVFGARAAVFFLWVILVFALTILVLSIQNERSSGSSGYSIRLQRRERVLISRALFHAPSSSSALSASYADQVVGTNGENADAADTLYGDDKRTIHTGPNPLHN